MNKVDYDVIVIGGGLVGASLACALAPTGVKIAMVEAVPPRSSAQPSYDERRLAVAQGSRRILSTMGLWGEIEKLDATPIKHVHISDRGRFGMTRLHHHRFDVDALGYVVPARVLGQVLHRGIAAATNVDLICPATVDDLTSAADSAGVRVKTDTRGFSLTARLVVAADGAGSAAVDLLPVARQRRGYGQTAILTTVTPGIPHDYTAYERFTKSGPLALLPTSDNRFAVVRTARSADVPRLMALSDPEFLAHLQERFGDRAGLFSRLGRRFTHDLAFARIDEPLGERTVVIGNAAHTVHPVAGQGFNLGLRDVATLADVVSAAIQTGADIGGADCLQRYARWRRTDVQRVSRFTDGLIRVFATDFSPYAVARNIGLLALDRLPPAQHFLVKRTMGLAGTLPRLARGIPLG